MEPNPRLVEVITESLCVKAERVTNETTLKELGADSALYVDEIKLEIEDVFGIRLTGTISVDTTVGRLGEMIKEQAASRGGGD